MESMCSQGASDSASFSSKKLGISEPLLSNLGNGKIGVRKAVFQWEWGGQHKGGAYLNHLGDFRACGLLPIFTYAIRVGVSLWPSLTPPQAPLGCSRANQSLRLRCGEEFVT